MRNINYRRLPGLCGLVILCCLLLCGCTSNIKLQSGDFPADTTDLTAVIEAGEIDLLSGFTDLQTADFSGSTCYQEIMAWAETHPDVAVRYTVELPDGTAADNSVKELSLPGLDNGQAADLLPLLEYLPELKNVDLGMGSMLDGGEVSALVAAYPDITFEYGFTLLGQSVTLDEQALSLCGIGHSDAEELLAWLPAMKELKTVDLGDDSAGLQWADIAAFQAANPNTVFEYAFTLYGKHFSLTDEEMNLSHVPVDDEGALAGQAAACMPQLRVLDMDSCGVSDEAMAEIRDALPDTEVIWRIWFGTGYSVRTNVERILASNPGRGGELTAENTVSLKYCTKVKYLDLGHNSHLSDISFVSYMPDLEALVVAMGNWSDVSPLANCPKLEYAEIQTSALNDLSPLAELKNLRHLNIAYCFALHDITPLYGLTELERLWIGCYTPIPQEQIEEMQRRAPNCSINTTTINPTEEGWRYLGYNEYGYMDLDPRYALLRQQFRYDEAPYCYAYYENDPLY